MPGRRTRPCAVTRGVDPRPQPPPACGKTHSRHSQRRTEVRASENVTPALPGHSTRPTASTRATPGTAGPPPCTARTGTGRPAAPSGGTSPASLQAEEAAGLLECGLQVPAAGVGLDHRHRRHRRVGAEEVLVPMRAGLVLDEHPDDRHQALARLVPVPRAGGDARPAVAPRRTRPPPRSEARPRPPPASAWAAVAPSPAAAPCPEYGGGGSNRLASGWSLLTRLRRARWRWTNRAISCVP